MMLDFPATSDFSGLNRPVGVETTLTGLTVEGTLPHEVRGAFFRAVPDPAFVPLHSDDTALSGDGMISKLHFRDDGRVDFAIRFVETARRKAEIAAGRALFGRYRNPFTDDSSVAGVDRTVANTTPVWHAGRLLMTKEDGRPYRVDPATLDTLGSYDFDGALTSETMTAHVRIDPVTREMFLFGYEADGLCGTKVAYAIVAADGRLMREQLFDVPYCSMMHDFAITEHYALFPVFPTTADLDRVKAGGDHWIHEPDLESWLGVMPRYGDATEMRWFKGPKGVSAYHMMNAFEGADGRIHLDHHMSGSNAFPFIQRASGLNIPPHELGGGFVRWSVDFRETGAIIDQRPLGPPGDFPRIADADLGRSYVRGWYLSMNPAMQGPPLMGGPVGAMFNSLLRIEPESGRIDALNLPPLTGFNEPVHIPSATGGEGWLMMIVDRQTGDDVFVHEAWIVDGGDVAAGPVAKVAIPARLRPQVHGTWISADDLERACL